MYAFDKIESGKRGHKGELVPRVEEAVRIAANVKARQTKLQDAAMDLLEQRIRSDRLTENGIIICCCEPGEVEKNLAGLVANKIQAKYQHRRIGALSLHYYEINRMDPQLYATRRDAGLFYL